MGLLEDELPPHPAISAPAATLAPVKKVRRDIVLSLKWFGPDFTDRTPIEAGVDVVGSPSSFIEGTGPCDDSDS